MVVYDNYLHLEWAYSLEIYYTLILMKKQSAHYYLSRPILFSIGLHVLFISGIIYASTLSNLPRRLDDGVMNTIMIDPMMLTTAEFVTSQTAQTADPEAATAQKPISAPDPIETDVKSEPEPIPEPIVEKKLASVVKSKLKPKPKTEVKPTKSKNSQPKTEQPQNINSASSSTPISSVQASGSGTSNVSAPRALSQAKPVYSERARAMGLEGSVVVKYDIEANGRVVNINIISATPKNLFERDVKKAMARWRYEPRIAKNLQITFYFKLNGDITLRN